MSTMTTITKTAPRPITTHTQAGVVGAGGAGGAGGGGIGAGAVVKVLMSLSEKTLPSVIAVTRQK